jgi:N-methylhydantoinase A
MSPEPDPQWRVGVDIGGTFTDLVVSDLGGAVRVHKVLSVPEDPSAGVMAALGAAAAARGLGIGRFLAQCTLFVHGSTVATNALLERKGAKVGLLATRGFRDTLEIRRGHRTNQWDHRTPFPPVLVPRDLRLPVGGRIDRDGLEREAVDRDDVEAAIATFRRKGAESVAVCLLNCFLNPAHERDVAAQVVEGLPGSAVSVSHEIAPSMGEYERTSTTVVNAFLAPRIVRYLTALQSRLRDEGMRCPLLLVQNNGGMAGVDHMTRRPAALALSGPAAGVGALGFYGASAETRNLMSMEIGGTSCDVMLMEEGTVPVSDALSVGGYHVALPSVDIHTIGAGGGTIAGVDAGGMLFVGPRGAGADPGPACYGRGGVEPTVTDALLVLGRLRPGAYAGGAVMLDPALAERAVRTRVAEPLGIDAESAAAGIIRVLEQNLLLAVQHVSIARGHDPRRFTLVACGGAGPMHGAAVGRALGCRTVYAPRDAGAFCAIGMLHADVRHDLTCVLIGDLDAMSDDAVERGFADLAEDGRGRLVDDGFAESDIRIERAMDLSYSDQQWTVQVPVGSDRFSALAVRSAFEREYDRLFGHIQPGGHIRIVNLRVTARGIMPPLRPTEPEGAVAAASPVDHRRAYVGAHAGWVEVPVYAGIDLRPGHVLDGPLLIEERTTTVFAGPGDRVAVDRAGHFRITFPGETP